MKRFQRVLGVLLAILMFLLMWTYTASADDDDIQTGSTSQTPVPTLDSGSGWYEPYQTAAVANEKDMVMGPSPAATDDAGGNVLIKLYLIYKGVEINDGQNLSLLEISPIVPDSLESYPFQITWSNYTMGVADLKKGETITGRHTPGQGSNTSASRWYFPFQFKTKKDVVNGTYAIPFKIRFLHTGQNQFVTPPAETTVTAYVAISHGKEPEGTPTPSPTPTETPMPTPQPKARMILKSAEMLPESVIGGESFDLTLVIENTNSDMAARNMKLTLSEANGTVMPESGSNTFFIEAIGPGATEEIPIRMVSLPNAGAEPVKMTLKMEYDDRNAANVESEEFTLQVRQVINVRTDEPVYATDAYVDESFPLTMKFYNVGKATMYNTFVRLESDTMTADETLFAGNLTAGQQNEFDVMVTVTSDKLQNGSIGEDYDPSQLLEPGLDDNEGAPEYVDEPIAIDAPIGAVFIGRSAYGGVGMVYSSSMMGMDGGGGINTMVCEGNIVITYEDELGAEFRKEVPITVNIRSFDQAYAYNDPYAGLEYDYDSGRWIDRMTGQIFTNDPVTGELVPFDPGINPWIIIGSVGGGVLVLVVALIVVLRVRKKRKQKKAQELELAHEIDEDAGMGT